MIKNPALLTTRQVANMHMVHTHTVAGWITRGILIHETSVRLSAYRAGKHWRILASDLEIFIAALRAALKPAHLEATNV